MCDILDLAHYCTFVFENGRQNDKHLGEGEKNKTSNILEVSILLECRSLKSKGKETEFQSTRYIARGRTRTGTALRPKDFKSFASTNSATRA